MKQKGELAVIFGTSRASNGLEVRFAMFGREKFGLPRYEVHAVHPLSLGAGSGHGNRRDPCPESVGLIYIRNVERGGLSHGCV